MKREEKNGPRISKDSIYIFLRIVINIFIVLRIRDEGIPMDGKDGAQRRFAFVKNQF